MATSKRPRKAYRPRAVINPLNMRDACDIELDPHIALTALEYGEVSELQLSRIAAHADIVRRMYKSGPEHQHANSIIRIVSEIKRRSNGLRVHALELSALQASMSITLSAVRDAGNSAIYHAAQAALHDMERYGGVRIAL